MLSNLLNMSTQSMNAIFSCLATQSNLVLWLRDTSYEKQLFVSESFKTLWGTHADQLYENPACWGDLLMPCEKGKILKEITKRKTNPHENNGHTIIFKLSHKTTGELVFFKDTSFLMTDKQSQPVAIAGIAEPISEQMYTALLSSEQLREKESDDLMQAPIVGTDFLTLLNDSCALNKQAVTPVLEHGSVNLSQIKVIAEKLQKKVFFETNMKISERESQCLYCLMQGKTAKATGELLFISPRTVEMHVDSLKDKFGCRRKSEIPQYFMPLLSSLLSNEEIIFE